MYSNSNYCMLHRKISYSGSSGALIGLMLIALGSGGIKPCVSSLGADQFGSGPCEQRQMSRYFSIFYFTLNLASLVSYLITPILRGKIFCSLYLSKRTHCLQKWVNDCESFLFQPMSSVSAVITVTRLLLVFQRHCCSSESVSIFRNSIIFQ